MKKILNIIKWFFIVVIALGVVGALLGGGTGGKTPSSSNSSKKEETVTQQTATQEKEPEPVQQIEYTTYDISEMMDDLDNNALKAQDKYKGQYIEITGRLNVVDASGKYISLARLDDEYALTGVHCTLTNSNQKAQVAEMTLNDSVTLRGKCTDVGEVLGYYLDVDSIDGYEPGEAASTEMVDGYIVRTADELEDDLKDNALKAQNTYKGQMVSITGRLSNVDSNGKYINISPIYNDFSFTNIQCYVKNDDVKAMVMELNKNDTVTIKGKCTDVGELIGYSINIETIE